MTGQTLKDRLAQLPISFAKIAEAIGMPAQQLQRVFSQQDIKTGILEKICASQNLPMTYFYPSEGVVVQTNVNRVRARNINTVSGDIQGNATASSGTNESQEKDTTIKMLLEQNSELIQLLKDKKNG